MLTSRTPIDEYYSRWKKAQKICLDKHVEALVVWGKGGGTIDTAFDLIYLSNYCPAFPYIADLPGSWSGISHAAIIIPAKGEPVLVSDTDLLRRDIVSVKDIRPAEGFVPDMVVDTLASMGLGDSRIGLVAGSSLVSNIYRRLMEIRKGIEFVDMDDAVESLRNIKTPYEFELIREAAEVGNASMLAMMKSAATLGTTEADAVAAAYNVAIRKGAAMIDAACSSGPYTHLYSDGMAPQWTTRELQAGDIFHCDMYGAAVEGYVWDFSRTVVNGGIWTPQQEEIYEGAIAAIQSGVDVCIAGTSANDVYRAVFDELSKRDIYCGYPIHGHSFGLGWGGPWLVPENNLEIVPGMAIAIECMAGREEVGYVKFEHNILIHSDHTELISTCPARI
ncbi:M24 family metallopeptidase (plasmid) [Klebsiella michiganensis]|uniref:M24 family metallopeptidase n=1 Tax=Klebsiella michiganensis TaxID=1134687 RepID=UPI00265ACF40|nr:M24 family metallopeptidase [Klebsiella michiganensis]WKJ95812.1 M24 family metallopeptidase [Klebsiella michiganensis]WKK01050.1 M24 family metallopeptidase [Klebsiella michiganensis]WKK02842.1 M24 family metallopeptidase [Klebsiella michiganensis]WKK07035.1 M24 family metallopeptidase [Klebsiella michiganensis]